MGCCASSTEYAVDPVTGQEKKKKTLGGAYPGQRRPTQQPHVPAASEFTNPDGTATVHFVAYGGGNALTMVRKDGTTAPEKGKPQPTYIQVTLPDGVSEGETIHVQAPDGRLNAIVIPPGFGPGSTFTVEFAPDELPPSKLSEQPLPPYKTATTNDGFATGFNNNTSNNNYSPSTPAGAATAENGADDGFATGFNNPYWRPPATATAVAANEPEIYADPYSGSTTHYPTTDAQPVYSSTPIYPSK